MLNMQKKQEKRKLTNILRKCNFYKWKICLDGTIPEADKNATGPAYEEYKKRRLKKMLKAEVTIVGAMWKRLSAILQTTNKFCFNSQDI